MLRTTVQQLIGQIEECQDSEQLLLVLNDIDHALDLTKRPQSLELDQESPFQKKRKRDQE